MGYEVEDNQREYIEELEQEIIKLETQLKAVEAYCRKEIAELDKKYSWEEGCGADAVACGVLRILKGDTDA